MSKLWQIKQKQQTWHVSPVLSNITWASHIIIEISDMLAKCDYEIEMAGVINSVIETCIHVITLSSIIPLVLVYSIIHMTNLALSINH